MAFTVKTGVGYIIYSCIYSLIIGASIDKYNQYECNK